MRALAPREQRLEGLVQPSARARRADDGERTRAAADPLGIEEKERHAAEMIAVEMRQDDEVDAVGIDLPAH